MTFVIDDLVQIEFSEVVYLKNGYTLPIFVDGSFVMDDLDYILFSGSAYMPSRQSFFSQGTEVVDSLVELEFSHAVYAGRSSPVYTGSTRQAPDFMELVPVVLPMLPGDTGFEIVFLYNVTPPSLVLPPLSIKRVGDIRLVYDNGYGISVVGGDLERDPGLETSIVLSLFTDKRASENDPLPNNSRDLRGWWADNELGSKLWLLSRSKNTEFVLAKAREYCLEALLWMITDGVASKITVKTEKVETYTVLIIVQIFEPKMGSSTYKYFYNWKMQKVEA